MECQDISIINHTDLPTCPIAPHDVYSAFAMIWIIALVLIWARIDRKERM